MFRCLRARGQNPSGGFIHGLLPLALGAVIIAAPAAGQSHVALGPLVTLGDDSHFGLGARAEMDLSDHLDIDHEFFRDIFGSATATYSFQDCRGGSGCGWLELGGNLNVPVTARAADLVGYVGAGFHVVSAFREESFVDFRPSPTRGTWQRRHTDTSVGLNLIGGLKFEVEATPAFVEGKLGLSGASQFLLSTGVMLW